MMVLCRQQKVYFLNWYLTLVVLFLVYEEKAISYLTSFIMAQLEIRRCERRAFHHTAYSNTMTDDVKGTQRTST